VARAIERVGQKLIGTVKPRRAAKRLRRDARTLVATRVADDLLGELDEAETGRLDDYLASPDFEEIVLQFVLGRLLEDVSWEDLTSSIREELRHGLRNSAGLRTELLVTATDVVFGALASTFNDIVVVPAGYRLNPGTAAVAAHLTAGAAANSRLLGEVGNLANFHEFARHMRAQVAAVHGHMRLPHLGVSRSVPYGQLYVEPLLSPEQEHMDAPELATVALPGRRSVILGDPGAGKSTLAAKLAHDVASDLVPGAEGRVPFLLVLRNFAGSFREGGKGLSYYLERVCRDPYNLEPPPKAVDYLLRNGRAVVLLDGLDELVEPELRRKFVQLVDGFVSRYPLVPVLVTARRIGYSDAPLDRRLFTVGVVAELNEDQVSQYAARWFVLDESTAEGERSRMAKSFLAESKGIADLRANPLLLALLCAMYSSEHYIPGSLAQVYERCAVMLFDRWDSIRGIAMPGQFQGRLRGAVQYLAWQLFSAEESGKALPRHRIVRMLADHLVAKRFDEDEAIATAEQFVDFCTGRAWILTDVGATRTEPRYGFTHRTFLEYFAAEHLVRTNPTADRLWVALRPRVLSGEWEVVTQIALQLLDRNVDGGVDDLLRLLLAETPLELQRGSRVHGFAARTLGYLHPGRDMISELVEAALSTSLTADIKDRFRYWFWDETFDRMRALDGPLRALMYGCSPGNLSAVRRFLTTILNDRIESGSETALFFVLNLSRETIGADERVVRVWEEARRDLCERHADSLVAWSEHTLWESLLAEAEPDRVVAKFGPWPLYLTGVFMARRILSRAEELLKSGMSSGGPQLNIGKLCDALVAAGRPWISDARWWSELPRTAMSNLWSHERMFFDAPWSHAPLAPMVLLTLPYLEARACGYLVLRLPTSTPLLRDLSAARAQGKAHPNLMRSLRDPAFTEELRAFLTSWARREFDVLAPPPWH
jgi:NACHT domain